MKEVFCSHELSLHMKNLVHFSPPRKFVTACKQSIRGLLQFLTQGDKPEIITSLIGEVGYS